MNDESPERPEAPLSGTSYVSAESRPRTASSPAPGRDRKAASRADAVGSAADEPPEDRWEELKPRVRLVGSVVIALLAILTLVAFAPSTDGSAERLGIWLDDAANQELTEGAPQQAVVNGWTENALLDLISTQLDAVDHRPAILLTLGVLVLALTAVTAPRSVPARRPDRRAGGPTDQPQTGQMP